MSVYKAYKFTDVKGRRLSIFGEVVDGGKKIDILVFTLNPLDKFSRVQSNRYYNSYKGTNKLKSHPGHYELYLKPEEQAKPMIAFVDWCRETFYTPCYISIPVNINIPIIVNSKGEVFTIDAEGRKVFKDLNIKPANIKLEGEDFVITQETEELEGPESLTT